MAADSASRTLDRIELFGVDIDTMRRPAIERRIAERLAERHAGLLHVATVNPEYIIAAGCDALFSRALGGADISVPDGVGIIAAVRILCSRPIERVTGVDLVDFLLSAETLRTARIFLLGNAESIAELQGRHPTRVVGRWGDGSAESVDDVESIERIRERNANVVLVGYGAPRQVLWIERNREALSDAGVKVVLGVGGALDFEAGTVARAPAVIRQIGLEWLYRLAREPWRWRRQLALPVFGSLVLRAWLRQRVLGDDSACRILAHDDETNRTSNP